MNRDRHIRNSWTCPKCSRKFADRNHPHLCQQLSLESYLREKPTPLLEMYQTIQSMLNRLGPYQVALTKEGIAFELSTVFASLTFRSHWLEGYFVFGKSQTHPRFRKIEALSPHLHLHYFRLKVAEDLDAEFFSWIQIAYRFNQHSSRLR